jgi:hypothetical protein
LTGVSGLAFGKICGIVPSKLLVVARLATLASAIGRFATHSVVVKADTARLSAIDERLFLTSLVDAAEIGQAFARFQALFIQSALWSTDAVATQ